MASQVVIPIAITLLSAAGGVAVGMSMCEQRTVESVPVEAPEDMYVEDWVLDDDDEFAPKVSNMRRKKAADLQAMSDSIQSVLKQKGKYATKR